MHDDEAVRATLTSFGDAMQQMDFAAVRGLWDPDHPHVLYQPEEYDGPCDTWPQIEAYWAHVPEVVTRILRWHHHDTDVVVIGDAAVAYTAVTTSFALEGLDEPFDGESRFTFALQRTGDGWRIFHAHESRQLVVS